MNNNIRFKQDLNNLDNENLNKKYVCKCYDG